MKTKFLSKTANKCLLFSIIIAVLLVASIVISVVFGVQYSSKTDNATTLTIQTSKLFYENDLEEMKDVCENEFAKQGLKVAYVYEDTRVANGDTREYVYVFESAQGVAEKVQTAKTELTKTIATNLANGGIWHGNTDIYVTTGSEVVKAKIPTSYVVKATIVAGVLSVLVGVYAIVRYDWKRGIVAFLAPIVGMTLSTSIILLARIPLTNAFFYAVAFGGMLSEVFTIFTLAKLRGETEETGEQRVYNSVAMKEMLVVSVALCVAFVLVGAIATWIVRWFAICALIALVSALYTGLLFIPSVLLPMQKCDDKKASERTASGYVGAKKKKEQE